MVSQHLLDGVGNLLRSRGPLRNRAKARHAVRDLVATPGARHRAGADPPAGAVLVFPWLSVQSQDDSAPVGIVALGAGGAMTAQAVDGATPDSGQSETGETSDGPNVGPDANPNEPGHQDADESGEETETADDDTNTGPDADPNEPGHQDAVDDDAAEESTAPPNGGAVDLRTAWGRAGSPCQPAPRRPGRTDAQSRADNTPSSPAGHEESPVQSQYLQAGRWLSARIRTGVYADRRVQSAFAAPARGSLFSLGRQPGGDLDRCQGAVTAARVNVPAIW